MTSDINASNLIHTGLVAYRFRKAGRLFVVHIWKAMFLTLVIRICGR